MTSQGAAQLVRATEEVIRSDKELRVAILSIGIPILLGDGRSLLRGPEVKIPPYAGSDVFSVTPDTVDTWAHNGWVDLREANMETWRQRVEDYLERARSADSTDTSSNFPWDRVASDSLDEIHPGKLVAHVFIEEEKGARIKR